jgi:integrase
LAVDSNALRLLRTDAGYNPEKSLVCSILKNLKCGKSQEDYVFTRGDSRAIKSIKEACVSARDKADIEDYRFHDLRLTAAGLLAAEGCDIIILKDILGHKTLAMTQRYAHLIKDRHEKTRQIMQSVWQSSDTVGDTVPERLEKPPLSN